MGERCNPSSSSLHFSMEGREKSSDGDCVQVVEVGPRWWLTNDEEVNDDEDDDDGQVNAADMCSRTIAHATTDKASLRMRPLARPLDLTV